MTVNVYKGKSVTTLIAAAKDGKDHSKVVLPVLRAHPQDQIYPGLALYYKETGAQQLKVAQKLLNLLDKVSEGEYRQQSAWNLEESNPTAQVEFLTTVFNQPFTKQVKRGSSCLNRITVNPTLLKSYYRDYTAVGAVFRGFNRYLNDFHATPPAESEGEDEENEVDNLLGGFGQMPTSLEQPNLYVIGGLEV